MLTVTVQSTYCLVSQSLYSKHYTKRSTVFLKFNSRCSVQLPVHWSAKRQAACSFLFGSVVWRFLAPVKIVSLAGRCHGEVICLRREEGAQPTMSRQIGCMLIYGVEVQGPEGLSFEAAWILIRTARLDIKFFYVLPTQLHLCVLCGSENKQRLFHCTALTGWFL